jgi:hypothetical protein
LQIPGRGRALHPIKAIFFTKNGGFIGTAFELGQEDSTAEEKPLYPGEKPYEGEKPLYPGRMVAVAQ